MAVLNGSDFGTSNADGVDMTAWSLKPLQTGTITDHTATSVTIDVGGHHYVLTGQHFVYLASTSGHIVLAGGTITGIGYYPDLHDGPGGIVVDLPIYTVSDFHLSVASFNDFVAHNNVAGYQNALFHDDDQLNGGGGIDHLLGLGGDDNLSGGGADDFLSGGIGHDILTGGAGADRLDGGRGHDSFVYTNAADSTAGVYDSVEGFSTLKDTLIVSHPIAAIDPTLHGTTDSLTKVDATLVTTADEAHLGAYHAVLVHMTFTEPKIGTPIAPETYLVIDENGVAGYQPGQDAVIRLDNTHHLHALSIDNFIAPILAGG